MSEEIAVQKTQTPDQPKRFDVVLETKLNEVATSLPQGFNIQRFCHNGVALLNGNEALRNYANSYGSANILLGMMNAAYLGLDFMHKEAYLIPYGKQLTFMKDYRGDIKLVKKYSSRPVLDVYAELIREGDFFEREIIDGRHSVNFKPKPLSDAPIIGAFAVCVFKDGGMAVDTMTIKEMDASKGQSRAANGTAWKNFPGEMYKKTVLHRLCKHIPMDFENEIQRELFSEDMKCDFRAEPTPAVLNDLLEG